MRLKRSRIKECQIWKCEARKNNEGGTYEEYVSPFPVHAIVWPASGKLQTELYGNRVNDIFNVKIEDKYEISVDEKGKRLFHVGDKIFSEADVISLYTVSPDYRIISAKAYRHLLLEVERI